MSGARGVLSLIFLTVGPGTDGGSPPSSSSSSSTSRARFLGVGLVLRGVLAAVLEPVEAKLEVGLLGVA